MNSVLWSSSNTAWTTPLPLFDWLNKRFHFTLDPCCTKETALCQKFFTEEEDGLAHSWRGERVFMNPPYGRDVIKWVKKAYHESMSGALVVGLLPARTETRWWHKYVANHAQVVFVFGRLKFGGAKNPATFPSAIVLWFGQETIGVF